MWEIILDILIDHWVNGLFIFLACLCNAGMDSLRSGFFKTSFAKNWNEQFWNPALSWTNKYTSWLPDALTDGWHLLKMLMIGFNMIAMSWNATGGILTDLFLFIVYAVVWNVPFPYMYYKLRGKKGKKDV